MRGDPAARLTADELVAECEKLCYPLTSREFGTITKFDNGYWGFIAPELGKSIFFHKDSLYGAVKISVEDRVWFARHVGGRNDRAFPVIKVEDAAPYHGT